MATNTNIDSRINRLVGQIEGIRRMINSNRDCTDVAQQILAAREALSKIGLLVLKEGICTTKPQSNSRVEEILTRVFRI